MEIDGTSAMVTGGASGLGAATVRLLSERGVRVVIADLQDEAGEALARQVNGTFVHVDVIDEREVVAAVEAASELGPFRSLVNCAGIGWAGRTIGRDGAYDSAHGARSIASVWLPLR
jgi:NAD(P)-dependent dehydrogenase (short-subunit alcohol dehydrogenase family)